MERLNSTGKIWQTWIQLNKLYQITHNWLSPICKLYQRDIKSPRNHVISCSIFIIDWLNIVAGRSIGLALCYTFSLLISNRVYSLYSSMFRICGYTLFSNIPTSTISLCYHLWSKVFCFSGTNISKHTLLQHESCVGLTRRQCNAFPQFS